MPGGCFHTLSLAQFLGSVHDFHIRVANGHGRVEITRDDCDDVCILISKAEIESLERRWKFSLKHPISSQCART